MNKEDVLADLRLDLASWVNETYAPLFQSLLSELPNELSELLKVAKTAKDIDFIIQELEHLGYQ